MNNKLENFLVGVVGLLLLVIVALIVQYNMQGEETANEYVYEENMVEETVKKDKANNYLQNLEGYADVDVKVDPTKEDDSNIVEVQAETSKSDLAIVVEDRSKSSYMENLENYTDEKKENGKSQDTDSSPEEDAPVKLEHEEIVDEVGMAIDAAISD